MLRLYAGFFCSKKIKLRTILMDIDSFCTLYFSLHVYSAAVYVSVIKL